jgi:hypothetical protein
MTRVSPMAHVAAAFALALATTASTPAAPGEKLGTVAFANSCSPAAQPELQRGVALLHSFWWTEGDKAFRDVLKRDPDCAVATWGIATIAMMNPFAAGPSPVRAKAAIEAIAQGRTIGAKTERERGYIEAITAYYDRFAERPHPARLRSLADAFAALAERYPDDDETQIFWALYLAATQPVTDKSFARTLQAAAILEMQFKKHPDHPGVAHYLIHSYDYPPIADKGLPAAKRYADIAPSAPHALHMPSHIFTRVGLWQESSATNLRSIEAAKAAGEATEHLHAFDYTIYADLQLAQDGEARRIVEQIDTIHEHNRAADYAHAAIPSRYAVERNAWSEAAQLAPPTESPFAYTSAIRYYARSLGAARSGDAATAEREAAHLRDIEAALREAKDGYWTAEVEVQRLGAEAWVTFAKGQHEQALGLMRQAADHEDTSEKSAISPGRLVPARELLGDMLLESGRPAEALAEYEASLAHDSRRFRSFAGAAQAAERTGTGEKARFYYARLVEMAGNGDPRPELAAAKRYLAAN